MYVLYLLIPTPHLYVIINYVKIVDILKKFKILYIFVIISKYLVNIRSTESNTFFSSIRNIFFFFLQEIDNLYY